MSTSSTASSVDTSTTGLTTTVAAGATSLGPFSNDVECTADFSTSPPTASCDVLVLPHPDASFPALTDNELRARLTIGSHVAIAATATATDVQASAPDESNLGFCTDAVLSDAVGAPVDTRCLYVQIQSTESYSMTAPALVTTTQQFPAESGIVPELLICSAPGVCVGGPGKPGTTATTVDYSPITTAPGIPISPTMDAVPTSTSSCGPASTPTNCVPALPDGGALGLGASLLGAALWHLKLKG